MQGYEYINCAGGIASAPVPKSIDAELKKKVDEICTKVKQLELKGQLDQFEPSDSELGNLRNQPEIACALLPMFLERSYEDLLEAKANSKDNGKLQIFPKALLN